MLTAADNIYVLHVFENDFQDYFLHHHHRDGDKADQLLVSWILLLAIVEDRDDISFLPFLRNCFQPP